MQKRFPLAPVLLVRRQHETVQERALAAVSGELQQVRSAILRAEQEIAEHSRRRAAALRQVLPAAEHQAFALRWQALQQRLAELQRTCAAVEARRAEQQARYLDARRHREMLTRLEEEHARNWEKLLAQRERKSLDAYAAAAHARRN